MIRHHELGFTLVEMMAVVIIITLVVAFSVPGFSNYSASHELKGAAENIAGQLRTAREKAISSGQTQTFHATYNFQGSDYHMHNNGIVDPKWKLPRKITYFYGTGFQNTFRMTSDGRCMDSGLIMIQDSRGLRDTVSVQLSGLVLHQ